MEKPKSVKAYLGGLKGEQKVAVEKLRDAIAAVVPEAEDAIVYSMPGFKLNGKSFVGYMAFKDHYSFFPMSTSAIDAHRKDLGDHVTGKGTISFDYGERLPVTLIKKVVKTRLAEGGIAALGDDNWIDDGPPRPGHRVPDDQQKKRDLGCTHEQVVRVLADGRGHDRADVQDR
jgi:uncharacterized protein YdhG (YjbR/CyaY superfamily)